MCDTFVALGNATSDGAVVFGKNGDREPNEAHERLLIPRTKHKESGRVFCAHIGLPLSQTTGSMISLLSPGLHTHWVTGTTAPCTSTFKPVWIDSGLPDLGPSSSGTYNDATLWWRHENLHRKILRD
jgi:dipeptidase